MCKLINQDCAKTMIKVFYKLQNLHHAILLSVIKLQTFMLHRE